MAFKPGKIKTGGRKPGSVNKKTDVFAKCEAHGIDVFEEMLILAATAIDPLERFSMLKELAGYLYPKRKALEVAGELDMRLIERVKELEALPDDELKKLVK